MNIRTAAKTAVALTWLCFSVASHAAQVECSNQGPMLFSDWIQVRSALLSRPAILRMITNSNGSSIDYLTRFQIDDSDVKIIEGSLAKRSDLSQVTEPFRVRSRIDKDFSSAIAVNRSVGFIYVKPAGCSDGTRHLLRR